MTNVLLESWSQLSRLMNVDGAVNGQSMVWNATTRQMMLNENTIYKAELTASSAQILALNSTPLDIVAAPGAGKAIVVVKGLLSLTYATAAYTTNLVVQLITETATYPQLQNNDVLGGATNQIGLFEDQANSTAQIIANKKLQLKVGT